MTIIYSWNCLPEKQIEPGMECAFVEFLRTPPHRVNPYRATIQQIEVEGEQFKMELAVTKPDRQKKYPSGTILTRFWNKEDAHSGTTLIYSHYETTANPQHGHADIIMLIPKQV